VFIFVYLPRVHRYFDFIYPISSMRAHQHTAGPPFLGPEGGGKGKKEKEKEGSLAVALLFFPGAIGVEINKM
jgi:hypothetical protein